MKIQWSVLFALFLFVLAGCGSEQFGSVPQSTTSNPDAVSSYNQLSCSSSTLIKPKVDILYVVDNSGSALSMSDAIKTSITNTIGSISQQFDYRVIGTKLIPDTATDYDYRVMTNSEDALPNTGKKIISASEMPFFTMPVVGAPREAGLKRTVNFINNNGSLIRNNSHLIVILVSNGRDNEAEIDDDGLASTPTIQQPVFSTRIGELNSIKSAKSLVELRFMPVTAHSDNCTPGARSSMNSYVAAGNIFGGEVFNLCGNNVSSLFAQVNSTIQQETIPHVYRYWPITFAENNEMVSISEIQVYKVSPNSAPTLMPSSSWTYRKIPGGTNTRIQPTVGEYSSLSHFVEFNPSSYVRWPDCVQIKSVSRTEYYKYIVLNKAADTTKPISVRINGSVVSSANWSYRGYVGTTNIKANYPNPGDDQPPVTKSGYMIEITNPASYYKSGDSVEVSFTGAAI